MMVMGQLVNASPSPQLSCCPGAGGSSSKASMGSVPTEREALVAPKLLPSGVYSLFSLISANGKFPATARGGSIGNSSSSMVSWWVEGLLLPRSVLGSSGGFWLNPARPAGRLHMDTSSLRVASTKLFREHFCPLSCGWNWQNQRGEFMLFKPSTGTLCLNLGRAGFMHSGFHSSSRFGWHNSCFPRFLPGEQTVQQVKIFTRTNKAPFLEHIPS